MLFTFLAKGYERGSMMLTSNLLIPTLSECDSMKGHMSDAAQPRAFTNHPDLSDPVEQERLSPAAVGAFVNIATVWSLNDVQALGLLGVVTPPLSLNGRPVWREQHSTRTRS
ncbi:hypothetical protein [Tunturiibacter gelidiferens]|uniref:hypothetical protein n=1 Tax=Tunturiibacter gelidiferens TaxID=3069689 RepID=UPI003D9BA529